MATDSCAYTESQAALASGIEADKLPTVASSSGARCARQTGREALQLSSSPSPAQPRLCVAQSKQLVFKNGLRLVQQRTKTLLQARPDHGRALRGVQASSPFVRYADQSRGLYASAYWGGLNTWLEKVSAWLALHGRLPFKQFYAPFPISI